MFRIPNQSSSSTSVALFSKIAVAIAFVALGFSFNSPASADIVITGDWTTGVDTASTTAAGVTITLNVIQDANTATSFDAGHVINDGPNSGSSTGLWSNVDTTANAALRLEYQWDTSAEPGSQASDDGGTANFTFSFSEAILNPIIHFDRIGGFEKAGAQPFISNSSRWDFLGAGSITKLNGNSQFELTGNSFFRTPNADLGLVDPGQEVNPFNDLNDGLGTAGGSLMFNGTFNSLSFDVTGVGIEGGGDGVELAIQFNSVPEPSSVALLGLSGLGMCIRRRRRA